MKTLLTVYSFFLIFALLLIGFFHPITEMDQDLGRHLLTGSIILETQTVPKTNLFSYTYPDFPFINTHWLSEVMFTLIMNSFSFPGLMILSLLLVFAAFLPLCIFSWNRSKNAFALLTVSFLYLNVLFERTNIRPELFSFLFVSLFILILYKNREKFTRFIFILPFLELLWVNLHIYFFIGIVITGLFFVDELIRQRKNILLFLKRKAPLPSQLIIIGLITGGVFLISFANPNFAKGALYPLFLMNNYGYSIEENQNIWFLWNYSQKSTIAYFVLSALILFISLFITRRKTKIVDWLLAIAFTLIAYFAIRNFPLFVFTTFVPCVLAFSLVTEWFNAILLKRTHILFLFLLLMTVLYIFSASSLIAKRGFGYGVSKNGKKALDFFIANKLKGPIFNNFDIGSYIDYRLYPTEKVFVDGRPEAYPALFFQKIYIPMQLDKKLFEKRSNTYKFQSIVFSHTDQTPWGIQFISDITKSKQWKIVYLDDTFLILVKNVLQNKKIIQSFSIDKKNFKISRQHTTSTMSILKLARFFSIVDWQQQEEYLFSLLLEKDPDSCIALQNLSRLLTLRNDPALPAFTLRLQNCKN